MQNKIQLIINILLVGVIAYNMYTLKQDEQTITNQTHTIHVQSDYVTKAQTMLWFMGEALNQCSEPTGNSSKSATFQQKFKNSNNDSI